MAIIQCNSCNKRFSDKMTDCPFCGGRCSDYKDQEQKHESGSRISEPVTSIQQKSKTLINPILVISVVVAMAISFSAFVVYQNIQTRKANSQFSMMAGSLSANIIGLARNSEKLVDETEMTWRDAIFGNKRDFNDALFSLRIQRQKEIVEIQTATMEIASHIKTMTPPTGKEREFQRLKELYLLINKYAEMAISPTGSLQTYSQQSNALNVEVKSAVRELELMK